MLYGLSAIIELSSEPLWIVSQINLMVKFRAIVEALSLFIRIILSTILFFQWPHMGLYAFGVAQLVYCLFISASYHLYFRLILAQKPPTVTSITKYRDLFPDIRQVRIFL